jgi:hypothetical protein
MSDESHLLFTLFNGENVLHGFMISRVHVGT